MRLNKFIARTGLCSRRNADDLIKNNLIKVNGNIINDLSYQVKKDDKIEHNNQLLRINKQALYLFHKPKKCLTSKSDPLARKLIYDYLPEDLQNFSPIGRLDYNSEGLLLLTNDGELKRFYELPKNNIIRKYKVRIFGKLNLATIKKIESGITIDGIKYKKCHIKILREGVNSWLEILLSEGKNREIRKIFEYFGHPVTRLIRISYGKFKLENLAAGKIKELDI